MQKPSNSFGRRRLLAGAAAVTASSILASTLSRSDAFAQAQSFAAAPPGWKRESVSVTDSGSTLTRTFVAHIPPTPPKVPAVIVFHGGGQDAEAMLQHWQSVESLCAIVCPDALVEPSSGLTKWDFARPGDSTVPTRDLRFTEALLDWLSTSGRIDLDRVYAAGFSSGGDFTWQLTVLNRFVNRFRGYAPVSAIPNTGMLKLAETPAVTTPRPLAFAMGTADYNWSRVLSDEQQFVPPDVMNSWIGRNRTLGSYPPVVYSCGRGSGARLEARVDPFAVEQLYPPDPAVSDSAAISYLTIVNGTHAWPLTGSDPTGRGLVTHDIDWTARIVSFWTTYAGMGLPISPTWRQCY